MKSLKSTTLILLTTIVLAGAASGCSTKDPGRATTEPPTSPGTQTTSPSKSAPVSGPDLDLNKFASNPCDLLKADQLAQLGTFKAPTTRDAPLGPSCRWNPQNIKGATYSVTLSTKGNTFESMMENAKAGPVFKETVVAGYPAYNSDITNGKGNCATTVRTSGKDAVAVAIALENEDAPEYKDSCSFAEKAAALVVQNLKG